jgi:hypothetical protein
VRTDVIALNPNKIGKGTPDLDRHLDHQCKSALHWVDRQKGRFRLEFALPMKYDRKAKF